MTLIVDRPRRAGLRGLDELSRQRAELLASRVAIIERLPITAGAPQVVLEQLASASQLCPLPPGVDVVVEGAPAHAFYAVIDGQRGRPSRRRRGRSPRARATSSASVACSTTHRGTRPSRPKNRAPCCGWRATSCSMRCSPRRRCCPRIDRSEPGTRDRTGRSDDARRRPDVGGCVTGVGALPTRPSS